VAVISQQPPLKMQQPPRVDDQPLLIGRKAPEVNVPHVLPLVIVILKLLSR
jgi:hypothetical protein